VRQKYLCPEKGWHSVEKTLTIDKGLVFLSFWRVEKLTTFERNLILC